MLKLLLFFVLMGTYCQAQAEQAASQLESGPDGEKNAFSKLVDEILRFISNLPIASGLGGNGQMSSFEVDDRADRGGCKPIPNASCKQHNMVPQGSCCSVQNGCVDNFEGECKMAWQNSERCDFALLNSCGNGSECYCCVDCMKNVATACRLGKGVCMKECDKFSYSSTTSCHYSECSCCHTCYDVKCGKDNVSVCLSNEKECTDGYYTTPNKCIGGNCTCCTPCPISASCRAAGGYPLRNTSTCRSNFIADSTDGYEQCICCKPDSPDSAVCKLSDDQNLKENAKLSFCTDGACPPNYKTLYSGCANSAKSCVRCVPGGFSPFEIHENCTKDDGYCSKKGCTRKGFLPYGGGCTSNDDIPAICCKPECAKFS